LMLARSPEEEERESRVREWSTAGKRNPCPNSTEWWARHVRRGGPRLS
jgi:hypothetical protein